MIVCFFFKIIFEILTKVGLEFDAHWLLNQTLTY